VAWRERIIRGEVERRLVEEAWLIEVEVRRRLRLGSGRGLTGPWDLATDARQQEAPAASEPKAQARAARDQAKRELRGLYANVGK
jgi:hypothetical protein